MTGRGRPPIGARVEVRLTAEIHDELKKRASQAGVPTAALARRVLSEWCNGPDWTLTDWIVNDF